MIQIFLYMSTLTILCRGLGGAVSSKLELNRLESELIKMILILPMTMLILEVNLFLKNQGISSVTVFLIFNLICFFFPSTLLGGVLLAVEH